MYKKHIKRWLDFLLALMVMPFVLLLIIIMAPFIYLSDPGPVFYNGKRRGKDGVPFKMFKFRSMYVNSRISEILMDPPLMGIEIHE